MKASALGLLVYLLGFVGIVSIAAIPFRALVIIEHFIPHGGFFSSDTAYFLVVLAAVVVVLWFDALTLFRVFKCLTEAYCGPSVASGWVYLAMLGAVYLILEALIAFLGRLRGAGSIGKV